LASTLSGRFLEFRIAQATQQPHANRNRVGLLESEHQWRQIKAAAQHIAEPGRPFDRHAARLQGGNVAIDRADRHFQLLGDRRCRKWMPGRA
jgi:hypothetical protein